MPIFAFPGRVIKKR